jgi:hypothetical protein
LEVFQTNHADASPKQTHIPGSRGIEVQPLPLLRLSSVLETSECMATLDSVH